MNQLHIFDTSANVVCRSCQLTIDLMSNLTRVMTSVATGIMCICCINQQKLALNIVYCIGGRTLYSYNNSI